MRGAALKLPLVLIMFQRLTSIPNKVAALKGLGNEGQKLHRPEDTEMVLVAIERPVIERKQAGASRTQDLMRIDHFSAVLAFHLFERREDEFLAREVTGHVARRIASVTR